MPFKSNKQRKYLFAAKPDVARKMAKKCNDGNVKRLTPELFWVAKGKPWLL